MRYRQKPKSRRGAGRASCDPLLIGSASPDQELLDSISSRWQIAYSSIGWWVPSSITTSRTDACVPICAKIPLKSIPKGQVRVASGTIKSTFFPVFRGWAGFVNYLEQLFVAEV